MTGEANETSELKYKQGLAGWLGLRVRPGLAGAGPRPARPMQLLRSVQQQAEEAEADTHRIQQREITSRVGAGAWGLGGQLLIKVNKRDSKTSRVC